MAKKNRIFTGLLAAMVVFVMLFASFYIISETGHHCVGDDCPICCQISVLEGALKSVSFASCAVAAAAVTVWVKDLFSGMFAGDVPVCTPVSLKVKLSN